MTTLKVELRDEQAQQLLELAQKLGMGSEDLVRLKIEEFLRTKVERAAEYELQPPETRKQGMEGLRKLREMLPPDFKPPTDEEVEQILHERRMRKYG